MPYQMPSDRNSAKDITKWVISGKTLQFWRRGIASYNVAYILNVRTFVSCGTRGSRHSAVSNGPACTEIGT